MRAFVEASYEYHWAPLLGCLVGHLSQIGAEHPSYVIGAVTGISYQPPQDAELPAVLSAGLTALGVEPRIAELSRPNRLQRFRLRRRIRDELRADRPVTAFGIGVSAFGPTWGLIVGCDDERRAWRRAGPMTEQVSPWLAESELLVSPALILITVRRIGDPGQDAIAGIAARAFADASGRARRDLRERIELLESDLEIEPQRYAHEAQTLAANWGEAATFWTSCSHDAYTPIAQQMAVTLSRYATLFPYPMGGQPNHPGVRSAAIHILREAGAALGFGR